MTEKLEALAADGFGYWLAGFIDGEGSFTINYLPKQDTYQCRVTVVLRNDDLPVLQQILERTGLGSISFMHHEKRNANPQARWGVWSRHDALALVEILDRFPLLAKKKHDYAVWRRAVSEWAEHLGKSNIGTLPAFKAELEAVRKYPAGDAALAFGIL